MRVWLGTRVAKKGGLYYYYGYVWNEVERGSIYTVLHLLEYDGL